MKIETTLPDTTMTVAAFERWLDTRFESPYSPKTKRVYLSVILHFVASLQKQSIHHFEKLTIPWLRAFVTVNLDSGKAYAKSYQVLRCAALNLLWLWLLDHGVVKSNPILLLMEERRHNRNGPRPQGGKTPQRLPSVLMWDDQRSLLLAVQQAKQRSRIRDYAMISLFLATGMRCEELCHAKLSHLSLQYKRIRIIGKGNKERIINFDHDDLVTPTIEAWLEERQSLLDWLTVGSPYLFVSRSGKMLTESLVYQQVSKYITQAGLGGKVEKKGPHILRHTAASIMFARQVPLLRIQRNLGHGDLGTTQIYAHMLPNEHTETEMAASST